MNENEIITRYAEIDAIWGSTGRNIYSCSKGHFTLTIHEDRGVTPMFMPCNCGEMSNSLGYNVSQSGDIKINNNRLLIEKPYATKYWVRPPVEWLLAKFKEGENEEVNYFILTIHHVLDGGLLLKSDVFLPLDFKDYKLHDIEDVSFIKFFRKAILINLKTDRHLTYNITIDQVNQIIPIPEKRITSLQRIEVYCKIMGWSFAPAGKDRFKIKCDCSKNFNLK